MAWSLPYYNLLFELETDEPLAFDGFMGSCLRGAYGHAFRRIVCSRIGCHSPDACAEARRCPYARVFEPKSEYFGLSSEKRYSEIPRPYVIIPPHDPKGRTTLCFMMRVFGSACEYLPCFIASWNQAGQTGITGARVRFKVKKVWHTSLSDSEPQRVFETGRLVRTDPAEAAELMATYASDPNFIRLATPLRLRVDGSMRDQIRASDFVAALVRRLAVLVRVWGDGELPDFRDLTVRAEEDLDWRPSLRWLDWERWSNRQNSKIKMGGLIGEIEVSGQVSDYEPLLRLGELTGVGKGCVLGLGQYRLESAISEAEGEQRGRCGPAIRLPQGSAT